MYINPFWAGVIATILAELIVMFAASMYLVAKRGKNHGN